MIFEAEFLKNGLCIDFHYFMSRFSEDVGAAIEKAINEKIGEMFNAFERDRLKKRINEIPFHFGYHGGRWRESSLTLEIIVVNRISK